MTPPPIEDINVGAAADDGTGDDARASFQKTNVGLQATRDLNTATGLAQGVTSVGGYTEPVTADWDPTDSVVQSLSKLRKAADDASSDVALTSPGGSTFHLGANDAGAVSVAPDVTLQPPHPPLEGQQHSTLWALSRYGTGQKWIIPARGDAAIAHTPAFYVASAMLPDYTFSDPVKIRFSAAGDYVAGSPDPRICLGFEIRGKDVPATAIKPDDGYIRGIVNSVAEVGEDAGIQFSVRTAGENALALDTGERVHWRIEGTVEFLPHSSIPFGPGGTSNVHVTGKMTAGPELAMRAGFHSSPGGMAQTETETWHPDRNVGGLMFPKGYLVSHHGKGYRSIWDQPAVAATAEAWAEQRNLTEPGAGRDWRHHWYPVKDEIEFEFFDGLTLPRTGASFHLKAGGAYAIDSLLARPAWTDVGGTTYDPVLALTDPTVEHGAGRAWVARFPHAATDSLEPGTGGEADRYWRELTADRRDEMNIYTTYASLEGGRVGVSDYHTI